MKIIGLVGKMGSGKDTLADALINSGKVDHRLAFADGVKDMCYALYGLNQEIPSSHNRKAWQITGEGIRNLCFQIQGHRDVWIDLAIGKALGLDPNGTFVITDVRYLNEMERLLELGHKVILIYTSQDVRRKRIAKRDGLIITDKEWFEWSNHPSEKEVDMIKNYIHKHVGFGAYIYYNDVSKTNIDLHNDFVKWFDTFIK